MRRRELQLGLCQLVFALLLTGCAHEVVDETTAEIDLSAMVHVRGVTKADGGFPVTEASVGDVFDGETVTAMPATDTVDTADLSRHMRVYRIQVEAGQTVAALMRGTEGDLDAYLLLRDPDYQNAGESFGQAIVAGAAEEDALIVFTAPRSGPYYLFAAGENLASGGAFRLDLIELTEDPGVDFSQTSPTLLFLSRELRSHEEDLGPLIGMGVVAEGEDGRVFEDPVGFAPLTLAEKVTVRRLIQAVNGRRASLFEWLNTAPGDERDLESEARIGRVCSELWRTLRG